MGAQGRVRPPCCRLRRVPVERPCRWLLGLPWSHQVAGRACRDATTHDQRRQTAKLQGVWLLQQGGRPHASRCHGHHRGGVSRVVLEEAFHLKVVGAPSGIGTSTCFFKYGSSCWMMASSHDPHPHTGAIGTSKAQKDVCPACSYIHMKKLCLPFSQNIGVTTIPSRVLGA